MNRFDSMFQADLDFFLFDFGREHRIGDKTIRGVIDTDTSLENPGSIKDPYFGLTKNKIRIFAKTEDLPKPEVNASLAVDGSFHRVISVSDEAGMLVIICEENNE